MGRETDTLGHIAELCRQYREQVPVQDEDGMVEPKAPLSWSTAAMIGCDVIAAIEELANAEETS